MAPHTRMPSSPRFTRPPFSVRHSPRLTNRKGVPTRMAPANKASSKVVKSKSGMTGLRSGCRQRLRLCLPAGFQRGEAAGDGFPRQQVAKQQALQDQRGGVRQIEPALQQAAAGFDAADDDCANDDGEWILARRKRHQDAAESITYQQRAIGAAVYGSDF